MGRSVALMTGTVGGVARRRAAEGDQGSVSEPGVTESMELVLTAIRMGCTVDRIGFAADRNGERGGPMEEDREPRP